MTETSQSEPTGSQIAVLLQQQKYEEALPVIIHLVEKNPADRELGMIYLLVVRILVLRWNLSRAATGPVNYSYPRTKSIIRRFASIVRISERIKTIQSFGQIYEASKTSWANQSMRRITIAGAGSAFVIILLAFAMVGASNVATLVDANILASTDPARGTISVSDAKAFNPNNPRITDGDGRQTHVATAGHERNFFRVASQLRELLPGEKSSSQVAVKKHLQNLTEQQSILSGTDITKAKPQADTSNTFAKRKLHTPTSASESSRKVAVNENNGNTTPREILGEYQSRRSISIRKAPNFAAATVREIDSGTSLNILGFTGSWAKVELGPGGIIGFVRREFLISIAPSVEKTADVTVLGFGSTS
jgi:hypothetical protein